MSKTKMQVTIQVACESEREAETVEYAIEKALEPLLFECSSTCDSDNARVSEYVPVA